MNDETYLGDGLYASFDGYQIVLRAPRADGNSEVFMEPSVVDAFLAYIKTLKAEAQSSVIDEIERVTK